MFGQFDRRSPSFINLGCCHACAGSTAAFDALTCENAGRARWWGGVTPMGAFGHYSQNYQQAYNGRRGVLVSALAALLIGGAPHIISFFLGQGNGILS